MSGATAVALLRRLVAHATVAGEPNGALVADVATWLQDAGARVHVLPGTRPDAQNLHAVLGPADAPGGLLLAAHGDVVGVDGQPWTVDPFRLTERDGRLYGRGTTDMKGFLAAALAAVARVDTGALRRPLHVALSSDEELGCRGIPPLLDALDALPVGPAAVLVGEPTELRVATRHKGKATLRITLTGRAAHSARPSEGVNAVVHAARLVTELSALQDAVAVELRDDAFFVPHATVGIGPIAGGVSVNIVPDACTLDVEIRTLPGQDQDALLDRIAAAARATEAAMRREQAPEAGVAIAPLARYPALAPDGADALAARVSVLAGGADRAAIAVDFGTEAGLYQQRLGVPVVVCGPGSMQQGHRADEYLDVAQLQRAQELVAALAHGLTSDAEAGTTSPERRLRGPAAPTS